MKPAARGHTAVMAQRREPPDSLDYFPTPPWATRALFVHVLKTDWIGSVWEPACGEGHMAEVIKEYASSVYATDIFDYGYGDVVDFLSWNTHCTWIITNPPFKAAAAFALQALEMAGVGVAILARTTWIESADRYERLFKPHPPTIVAPFVERVAMVKGRWDPQASTATAYAWFVWRPADHRETRLCLIPPCKRGLTKPDDVSRFAYKRGGPGLFSPEVTVA